MKKHTNYDEEDLLYGTLTFPDPMYSQDGTFTPGSTSATAACAFTVSPSTYTSTYIAPYMASLDNAEDLKKLDSFVKKHNIDPVDISKSTPIIQIDINNQPYSLIDILVKSNLSNPLTTELLVKTVSRLSKDVHDTNKRLLVIENKLDTLIDKL